MFKKTFQLHTRTTLKASASRAIKDQIATSFPTITDTDLNLLFPNKCVIIQDRVTTNTGVKIFIYYVDKDRPLFFDMNGGKGDADFLPTVYSMWLVPHLLRPVFVHPQVSTYVLQGADLMLPGVLHAAYEPWNKGDKKCIMARGNPAPFAVGVLCVDSAHIKTQGWIGRGLAICHYYGDYLWKSGDQSIPNTGFSSTHQIQSIINLEQVEVALEEAIKQTQIHSESTQQPEGMDGQDQLNKMQAAGTNLSTITNTEEKQEEKKEAKMEEVESVPSNDEETDIPEKTETDAAGPTASEVSLSEQQDQPASSEQEAQAEEEETLATTDQKDQISTQV